MKRLSKKEWVAVSVTIIGALAFFGVGSFVFRIFNTAFSAAVEDVDSSPASIEEVGRPTLIEGENANDLLIYEFDPGEGEGLKAGDVAVVHYMAFFMDGTPFDSSRGRNVPFRVTVGAGEVIEGWEQGLLGMKVGSKRRLVVPPELAYGEEGYGPIPGNATLVFDIELLDIEKAN